MWDERVSFRKREFFTVHLNKPLSHTWERGSNNHYSTRTACADRPPLPSRCLI